MYVLQRFKAHDSRSMHSPCSMDDTILNKKMRKAARDLGLRVYIVLESCRMGSSCSILRSGKVKFVRATTVAQRMLPTAKFNRGKLN